MGGIPHCLAVAPSCLHRRNLTGHTFLSMLHLQCCQRISMLGGLSRLRRGAPGLRTRMMCRSFMPNQPFSPSPHRQFNSGGYGRMEVAWNRLLHFPPRIPGGHCIVANWLIFNPVLRMVLPLRGLLCQHIPTPNALQPPRAKKSGRTMSVQWQTCVSFRALRPHFLFLIVCLCLARMRTLSRGIAHLPHVIGLLREWQYRCIHSALNEHGCLTRRVHLERAEECLYVHLPSL